ncbi:hypothetical protein E0F63_09720, partial [Streptococcus pyogenes]
MIRRALLAAVVVASQFGVSAGLAQTAPAAETVAVNAGSIGLRTGYDSNPTDILGAHGSPF